MTEHVHEWRLGCATANFVAFCKGCPEVMGINETQARLNATERLSAWLRTVANIIDMRRLPEKAGVMMDEDLFTMIEKEAIQHANILEGEMKAIGKPFPSKYDSGRCPVCKRRISKGAMIVRLEKEEEWIESKRMIPNSRGRFFTDLQTSQYAHDECLEKGD